MIRHTHHVKFQIQKLVLLPQILKIRKQNHKVNYLKPVSFFFFFLLLLQGAGIPSAHARTAQKAMVVTAHPLATEVALRILKEGGNAADAAVCAQWVLNVVEPQSSGIGGGGFFLYYEAATKRVFSFDGRETAPVDFKSEAFLDAKGQPIPYEPDRITGGMSVGVPGLLRMLHEVHDRFKSKKYSFSELFEPAIYLAEQGFPVSPRMAHFLEAEQGRLKLFKETRRIFFDAAGAPWKADTVMKIPELAETFRMIQQNGVNYFYEGPIAEDIVKAVKEAEFRPGIMKRDDLFYYHAAERPAVYGTYRGFDIFSMGPPSSGGTTLIEALNILELYTLRLHGRSADGIHLISEAQKLAFEDRNRYLGDPDFLEIPVKQLLSKEYARERSQLMNFQSVSGQKPQPVPIAEEPNHTSHLSIADEYGNLVAFTTTIEAVFGSGIVVPGRGFFLNNELSDFDPVPRDAKGVLAANAPEPEKRPRSSMTPAFVFREGKPVLVVGSPGGPRIIASVLNVIVNVLDFEMPIAAAVGAPRILNRGGSTELEAGLYYDMEVRSGLESKGHKVELIPDFGNAQVIFFEGDPQSFKGISDPRGEGRADGY